MSNFFPDQWKASSTPVLYVPGCSNGAVACSGNARNAMNPLTGQILVLPNSANSAAAIGTPVPGIGNPLNGIRQAGDGISKYGYTWPKLVVGPRFGVAYDITGNQSLVFRGGGGIFYDRPDGNTVFSIPGNPPIATSVDLRTSFLQNVGPRAGLRCRSRACQIFQYDAKVPASAQWEVGIQKTLPWASVVDVSYVGNHGYNRLGGFQDGTTVNLNAIDIGAAYLPQNQDPTLGAQTVPGAGALPQNLMRGYRGLGNINQQTTEFARHLPLDPEQLQPPLPERLQLRRQLHAEPVVHGQHRPDEAAPARRRRHRSPMRADQAEYEELMQAAEPPAAPPQGQLGVEPAERPDRTARA